MQVICPTSNQAIASGHMCGQGDGVGSALGSRMLGLDTFSFCLFRTSLLSCNLFVYAIRIPGGNNSFVGVQFRLLSDLTELFTTGEL